MNGLDFAIAGLGLGLFFVSVQAGRIHRELKQVHATLCELNYFSRTELAHRRKTRKWQPQPQSPTSVGGGS